MCAQWSRACANCAYKLGRTACYCTGTSSVNGTLPMLTHAILHALHVSGDSRRLTAPLLCIMCALLQLAVEVASEEQLVAFVKPGLPELRQSCAAIWLRCSALRRRGRRSKAAHRRRRTGPPACLRCSELRRCAGSRRLAVHHVLAHTHVPDAAKCFGMASLLRSRGHRPS